MNILDATHIDYQYSENEIPLNAGGFGADLHSNINGEYIFRYFNVWKLGDHKKWNLVAAVWQHGPNWNVCELPGSSRFATTSEAGHLEKLLAKKVAAIASK